MIALAQRTLGLTLAVVVSALLWKSYVEAGSWARVACLVVVGVALGLVISEVGTEASESPH